MKKVFSLFISLLIVLSVCSISVAAADCRHNGVVIIDRQIEPTCNSTGVGIGYCGICQKDVHVSIPKTDHQWIWTVTKEATLYSTGLKDGKCANYDNCKAIRTNVEIPKLACATHSVTGWDKSVNWTTVDGKEATCTEPGLEEAYCSGCKMYITREIPVKDHSIRVREKKEPTCLENGSEKDVYCVTCRTYLVVPKAIPATGHKYYLIVDVKEPTCTEKGQGHTYCLNGDCDYAKITDVAMIDHVDADNDKFCDECNVRICKCICHKDNFISRFIRKLNTLLNKLLNGGEQVFSCCKCMEPLA